MSDLACSGTSLSYLSSWSDPMRQASSAKLLVYCGGFLAARRPSRVGARGRFRQTLTGWADAVAPKEIDGRVANVVPNPAVPVLYDAICNTRAVNQAGISVVMSKTRDEVH